MSAHPPMEDKWWGNWAMASTNEQKDWVHLFVQRLKDDNRTTPGFQFKAYNMAGVGDNDVNLIDWEHYPAKVTDQEYQIVADSLAFRRYDEPLPAHVANLVVLFIGENVKDSTDFEHSMQKLMDVAKSHVAHPLFVIVSSFWEHSLVRLLDYKKKKVAAAHGALYVDITGYSSCNWVDEGMSEVCFISAGGDTMTVSDRNVLLHPSDDGHDKIARKIYEELCQHRDTGIKNVALDRDDVYYDLHGRVARNPKKGIYIHNGKKVYLRGN